MWAFSVRRAGRRRRLRWATTSRDPNQRILPQRDEFRGTWSAGVHGLFARLRRRAERGGGGAGGGAGRCAGARARGPAAAAAPGGHVPAPRRAHGARGSGGHRAQSGIGAGERPGAPRTATAKASSPPPSCSTPRPTCCAPGSTRPRRPPSSASPWPTSTARSADERERRRSKPAIEAESTDQALRRLRRGRRCHARRPRGRGLRPAGQQRRRQVDADPHVLRPAAAHLGQALVLGIDVARHPEGRQAAASAT